MSITKDGFYKHIAGDNTYIGNNNYVLLAGGGDIRLGNNINQVPISNTELNIGLNADMIDGVHVDEMLTYFDGGALTSEDNVLTQWPTYITVGGTTYSTNTRTANIINSLSINKLSSDTTYNLSLGITINGISSDEVNLKYTYSAYTARLITLNYNIFIFK